MGEKMAFMLSTFLFVICIVPFLLEGFILTIRTNQFYQATTFVDDLVDQNGGVNSTVQQTANSLNKNGLKIVFTNAKTGAVINTPQQPGTIVNVHYHCDLPGFFGNDQPLDTDDPVLISSR